MSNKGRWISPKENARKAREFAGEPEPEPPHVEPLCQICHVEPSVYHCSQCHFATCASKSCPKPKHVCPESITLP